MVAGRCLWWASLWLCGLVNKLLDALDLAAGQPAFLDDKKVGDGMANCVQELDQPPKSRPL